MEIAFLSWKISSAVWPLASLELSERAFSGAFEFIAISSGWSLQSVRIERNILSVVMLGGNIGLNYVAQSVERRLSLAGLIPGARKVLKVDSLDLVN